MNIQGTSWGKIPSLPLAAQLLPAFVVFEIALDSIPTRALLTMMAENSARAANENTEEGAPEEWNDTAEPDAERAKLLAAINEAGTILRLDKLTVGRENTQLSAERALRFAPATGTAPVFGTINYLIEGLGKIIGGFVHHAATLPDPASGDMVLALLIALEGFGEAHDGERDGGGAYTYSFENLETGDSYQRYSV